MDEVGVAEIGIGLSDAGPGTAVMQLRLRDGPERVAVAHRVLRRSARRGERSGHDNLRTNWEEVGIAKTWIERKQLLPATSVAESRRGELPERIARLDDDDS